jgi:GT2 family glycosyltransferase
MYLDYIALEKMVSFMDSNPSCGIGVPLQLDCKNPNYVIFAGGKEAFPSGKHQHGLLSIFNVNEQILWGNGACMLLRKKMILEIGLLDENYLFIGSDSDYCFTARSRGWQVWRIVEAKGVHECGASGDYSDINIELLKIRDMLYFANKWVTGGLYRELAFDVNNLTIEKINNVFNDLKQTEKELEKQSNHLVLKGTN